MYPGGPTPSVASFAGAHGYWITRRKRLFQCLVEHRIETIVFPLAGLAIGWPFFWHRSYGQLIGIDLGHGFNSYSAS